MRDDAPPRVNILIPTIDLDHFFGGYIAKFNLARRLAEPASACGSSPSTRSRRCPRDWQVSASSPIAGSHGLFDRVEVVFGRESAALEVSRGDRFVATTWWTAHVAAHAARALGGERFLYLIQEYEPFTFPMGTLRGAGEPVLCASRTSRCSRPSSCATTSAATASASTRRARSRR